MDASAASVCADMTDSEHPTHEAAFMECMRRCERGGDEEIFIFLSSREEAERAFIFGQHDAWHC